MAYRTSSSSNSLVGRRTLKLSQRNSNELEPENNSGFAVSYDDQPEVEDFTQNHRNSVTAEKRQTPPVKKTGFFGFGGKATESDQEAEEETVESPPVTPTQTNPCSQTQQPANSIYNDQPPAEPVKQPSLLWRIGSGAIGGGFTAVKTVGGFGLSAVTTVAGGAAKAVTTVGSGAVTVVKGTGNVVLHPIESVKTGVGAVGTGVGKVTGGTVSVVSAVGSGVASVGSGVATVGSGVVNGVVGTVSVGKNIMELGGVGGFGNLVKFSGISWISNFPNPAFPQCQSDRRRGPS